MPSLAIVDSFLYHAIFLQIYLTFQRKIVRRLDRRAVGIIESLHLQ
jgi:hypothetical protein